MPNTLIIYGVRAKKRFNHQNNLSANLLRVDFSAGGASIDGRNTPLHWDDEGIPYIYVPAERPIQINDVTQPILMEVIAHYTAEGAVRHPQPQGNIGRVAIPNVVGNNQQFAYSHCLQGQHLMLCYCDYILMFDVR